MGRFSCFYGHMQSHKQKKPSEPSSEEMMKMLQLANNHDSSAKSNTPMTVDYEAKSPSCNSERATLSPHGWKSDDLKCEYHAEGSKNSMVFEVGNLRRSLSLGCELDQKGWMYEDNNTDFCFDRECCFNRSHDCKTRAKSSSQNDQKSSCTSPRESYHYQEADLPVSRQESCSSLVNHESNFSVDESRILEKEDHENSNACADKTDRKNDTISKCYSMPNFEPGSPTGQDVSHSWNRSSEEDLNIQDDKDEGTSSPHHDVGTSRMAELNQDDDNGKFERSDEEDVAYDRFDSYDYSCSNKDWIVPESDEIDATKHEQTEFASHCSDHLPNADFKVKRIEDWVSDLQHLSPVEVSEEVADSCDEVKRGNGYIDGVGVVKASSKVNPGMEAAKKYISSLNAAANTAHLANHGLVVVPLLNAFVALKVLNLSGNSIVRITAGALPRGLHLLNLSKNKISAIEGLKELTRLRVLDLSYNKISRIGHGLASCSSLKELYLAGNKISEVEGLHRLLKLSVLDLRFNKIATSKCLGQLAANYNSLQAISLEGNPAQKNVGDEQLKKYLQSLLPQLAYYNRHHIKSTTLKDSSDRSIRLGISGGHKSSPHHGGSSLKQRTSSSSSLAQKGINTDSPKQPRGRRGPPSGGARVSHHHRVDADKEKQLQSLRVGFSFHKSRSESTLAGLQVSSSSSAAAAAAHNNS